MKTRRQFLTSSAAVLGGLTTPAGAQKKPQRVGGPEVKISLNAYSFNRALRGGEMTLDELLEFSAVTGFRAVDLTAYYFPGYPDPPSTKFINHIKRRAYLLGLDISGTGVRTDFTISDPAQRAADIEYVRNWTVAACHLGAPSLRIFAGSDTEDWNKALPLVVDSIKKCVAIGQEHGVMMVLQNHYHYIRTPEHILEILRLVDSEWLAVHLDIGSFRSEDPYAEIARIAPFAATWQIKESMYRGDRETRTDLRRIASILREADFRGYILVETLGEGDPRVKVPRFFHEVKEAVGES
jgi:sugar phosphate isomerase/epimerase